MRQLDRAEERHEAEAEPGPDITLLVVDAFRGCVVLLDGDHRIVATSAAFRRAFGLDPHAAPGQLVFALGDGCWDIPALRRMLEMASEEAGAPEAVAFDFPQGAREPRRLVGHAERLTAHPDQARARLLLTLDDVSPPQGASAPLPTFHVEQSLLLREARHRIANGLQIVASVLLQTARVTEADEARGHLQAAYGRVMAVAALERQLSDTSDEAVGLQGYLSDLCQQMAVASINDPTRVSLRTVVDSVEVSASTAASLGMIVTELVINALKHAFPGDRPGRVTVTYEARGTGWVLSVADNGVGMPEGRPQGGLGTEIVEALARHLKAGVEVANAFPGKITSIRFLGAGTAGAVAAA